MESHWDSPRKLSTKLLAIRIQESLTWKTIWGNRYQSQSRWACKENPLQNIHLLVKNHVINSSKEDATKVTNVSEPTSRTYHSMTMEVAAGFSSYPTAPEVRNATFTTTRTADLKHGKCWQSTESIRIKLDWWRPKKRPTDTSKEKTLHLRIQTR